MDEELELGSRRVWVRFGGFPIDVRRFEVREREDRGIGDVNLSSWLERMLTLARAEGFPKPPTTPMTSIPMPALTTRAESDPEDSETECLDRKIVRDVAIFLGPATNSHRALVLFRYRGERSCMLRL